VFDLNIKKIKTCAKNFSLLSSDLGDSGKLLQFC